MSTVSLWRDEKLADREASISYAIPVQRAIMVKNWYRNVAWIDGLT